MVVKSFAEATAGRLENYCLVASKVGPTRVESSGGETVHYLKERGTILLTPILPSLPWVLHRLRKERRFAAILLHYPNPMAVVALVLSLLVRRKTEKIVLWHHADVLLEEKWKRVLYSLFRPVEEFLFRRTDAFVAATPHHVACSDTFGRFADRTAIIPYAIPDPWFEVSDADRSSAEKTRKTMGGDFLLFVGRLVPYKGLETLLRAADRIPCRIAVIGTGSLDAALRKEIAARGLEEKVRLLGRVDDLRPYYLGCDFFVLPSVTALEGFGIVQIEAMALGKPVVSSDLPSGVTYVNVHGETGLTFHVGDDDGLAEACNRLLSDTELRGRLGENARRRTFEKFSYTAMREAAVPFFRAPLRSTPGGERPPDPRSSGGRFADLRVHHHSDQLFERHFCHPAEPLPGAGGVSNEPPHVDLADEVRVRLHVLFPLTTYVRERDLEELPDRVRLPRRQNVVVRIVLLENHPDPPDEVARVPPVPPRVEVSQGEFLLPAGRNLRGGPGDFLRHEMVRTSRRLVVVEDSTCDEHAVPASVEPGEEMGGEFAYTVRSNGVVRGPFVLGGLGGVAEYFRGGRLIEARGPAMIFDNLQKRGYEERVRLECAVRVVP